MSDNLIDHEIVRERVEKRLEPRLRLLRRRAWLLVHFIVFLVAMVLIHATSHVNSIFYYAITNIVPAYSYPDPNGVAISVPEQTYEYWTAYPLTTLLSWLWFVLLIVHVITIWSAFARERTIQREVDREMELEKMRVELELTRMRSGNGNDEEQEKPKRVARLSDDGELLYEQEPARRNKNHRNS